MQKLIYLPENFFFTQIPSTLEKKKKKDFCDHRASIKNYIIFL